MMLKNILPILLFPLFVSAQNTDSILYHMGMRLNDSLVNYDSTYFLSVFDADAFTNQFYLIDTSEKELVKFNQFYKKLVPRIMYSAIFKAVENGASYDFINFYQDFNGGCHLLFRLYQSDNGLNYHDYLLYPDETGALHITDVFMYISGEYMSETLSRIYYPEITRILNEDYFNKEKKNLYDSYGKMARINQYLEKDGNRTLARLLFRTIPKEIRQDKIFILMEFKMLEPDDDEAYTKLLEKYVKLYPDDPTICLWNIDRYYLRGEYQNALAMVDTLEELTGDDFLNNLRGKSYFLLEAYEKAEACFFYMVENYPYHEDSYLSLLETQLMLKKYADAVQLLDLLVKNFGYLRESLIDTVDSDYEIFSKTAEYQDWKNK